MRRVAVAAAAIVAGALLVTFPSWSSAWESSRYATTILRDMLVLAMFALSLDLLVGVAGMPSLGHAAFFGAGAYAAAITGQRLGTDDLLVGLLAAVGVSAVLALVIGLFAVRAAGIFFLMLTLAFAQMVFAIAFQATDLTGGSNGFAGVRRPTFAGFDFNAPEALFQLVAAVFILMLLVLWRIRSSAYGRALTGLRENERRMRALGYDTLRLRLSVFVLAGAFAGVAGALSAYALRFVSTNDVGVSRSVEAFVSVLIGGTGTLLGPVIGAGVVLYIERVLSSSIPYAETVLGVVFIVFVVAARQGIVGLTRTWSARAVRSRPALRGPGG
ncbi:MAG TPA: branched-chain amino acid ABC transporter permease [Candidatus Limnocylindrales bacterium]|nr:branched-chain amino acid ABC transporter permease [Candidatus Limnocylindrales bacterium]